MIEAIIEKIEVASVLNSELIVKLKNKDSINQFEASNFHGQTLMVKNKRAKSLNLNSYLWVLCEKIAQRTGITKEDVYRKAVREVGKWFDIHVKAGEETDLINSWQQNGIGWFAEEGFATRDYTNMRLYKGSSVYDMDEMRRLVNYIVDECKELGIETMTPAEIHQLQQLWKG